MDFEATSYLLIIYYAIITYLKKMGTQRCSASANLGFKKVYDSVRGGDFCKL